MTVFRCEEDLTTTNRRAYPNHAPGRAEFFKIHSRPIKGESPRASQTPADPSRLDSASPNVGFTGVWKDFNLIIFMSIAWLQPSRTVYIPYILSLQVTRSFSAVIRCLSLIVYLLVLVVIYIAPSRVSPTATSTTEASTFRIILYCIGQRSL